jgi:hypothetical protein
VEKFEISIEYPSPAIINLAANPDTVIIIQRVTSACGILGDLALPLQLQMPFKT